MYGVTVPMDSNPIKNVQNVCGTLFPTQVSCFNYFKLFQLLQIVSITSSCIMLICRSIN